MQYEIVVRFRGGREQKLLDRRSTRPTYSAFDVVPTEEKRTIAPNLAFAKDVRDAFLAWNTKHLTSGLGFENVKQVILRKYVPCPNS